MGQIERAIREAFAPPVRLATPVRDSPFMLRSFTSGGLALLLGKKEAYTPISWECLEGIAGYLHDRSWVEIGTKYEVISKPGTLDEYLKGCIVRVAAVLEGAGVVDVQRSRPAKVRLRAGY